MSARALYWSDVAVGEALPALTTEPVTRMHLVRYAGAAEAFDPLHVDDVAARESGLPGVSAPPMLAMAFVGRLVTAWTGSSGRLRRIGARFVKLVWPGDAVTCRGRVLGLHHHQGAYTVDLDLWAENPRGELVLKGSALVQLYYDAEDEARQARGSGPLVIDMPPPPPLEDRIGAPIRPLAEKETPRGARRRRSAAGGDGGAVAEKRSRRGGGERTQGIESKTRREQDGARTGGSGGGSDRRRRRAKKT